MPVCLLFPLPNFWKIIVPVALSMLCSSCIVLLLLRIIMDFVPHSSYKFVSCSWKYFWFFFFLVDLTSNFSTANNLHHSNEKKPPLSENLKIWTCIKTKNLQTLLGEVQLVLLILWCFSSHIKVCMPHTHRFLQHPDTLWPCHKVVLCHQSCRI